MAIQRTFSIIKPDATKRNLTGAINAKIEEAGLRIVAQKRIRMTREQAETFYGVHRERPFFGVRPALMDAEGKRLIHFRPVDPETLAIDRELATEPPLPEAIDSLDELYLTGEHLELYRHPNRYSEL